MNPCPTGIIFELEEKLAGPWVQDLRGSWQQSIDAWFGTALAQTIFIKKKRKAVD
jgi:hypothetical protein